MYLRTTSGATQNSMLNYIYSNQNKFNTLAEQLGSGHKLLKPSDDATGAIGVLNTNKQLNQINGYKTNISMAKNELNVLDGSLSQANKSLQRIYDLSISAANETNSPESIKAMKTEIDSLLEGLVDVSNTKYNDKYIFSGTNTTTAPYTKNPDGSIVYNGNSDAKGNRSIEISEGVKETINVSGDKVFGSYDAVKDKGSGMFETISHISQALGKTPPDYDAVRKNLDSVSGDLKNLSNVRTKYAAITNRLDMTMSTMETNETQLRAYRSSVQDVDYAQAATDYMTTQYALQATLAVTAQTSQMSLLNYL